MKNNYIQILKDIHEKNWKNFLKPWIDNDDSNPGKTTKLAFFVALQAVRGRGKQKYEEACRQRAVTCFNKDDRYADYVRLYERIVWETYMLYA